MVIGITQYTLKISYELFRYGSSVMIKGKFPSP